MQPSKQVQPSIKRERCKKESSLNSACVAGIATLLIAVTTLDSSAFDANSPYGVVAFIPSPTRWDAMEDAQIAWGRFDFAWKNIEATQGVYDWTTTDQVVAEANARGIHVYAGLGYCPTWASAGSDYRGPLNTTGKQAWADFVQACVSRYKDSIKYWELWNEPNLSQFWNGTRSQYIDDILKVGADAVHAADPTAKVCAPELAHLNSADWDDWLTDVIQQAGDKLDIVTHHCYADDPDEVNDKLETDKVWPWDPPSVREVLQDTGWFGKPFWLTETGWTSYNVGDTTQANYLAEFYGDWFPTQTSRAWLHKIFWYQIWESTGGDTYGLLYQDETRKPSWYAYHDYVLDHPAPITVSIDLNSPDIENNMTHPQPADGDTIPATIGGRSCRQNVDPNQDLYFYFAVDDDFVYQGDRSSLGVMIDYYDTGTGSLTLQYDATDGNAYKNASSVTLNGTDAWKQFRFCVTDAYFGNRQNDGADFRIARSATGGFYLDVVQVPIQLPAGSPSASFTADPTIGPPPLQVSFDASDSFDPNGTIVNYEWDFGDNSSGSGETTSHPYTNGGTYVARLTVTDNDDLINMATAEITVLGNHGVSIDLDSPDIENGLTHPQCGDGDTTPATIGSRTGRKNVDPATDIHFYFAVDDAFAHDGDKPRPDLYITIQYYDTGSGSLLLQYDSNNGDDTADKYKNDGSITLTGSNTWKQHIFHITDAYFGNRQNCGADFRIVKPGGGLFYLDTLHVNMPPDSIQADFDNDGDVDQEDFGHLQGCLSGYGIAAPPECRDANLDNDTDQDVDTDDFAIFQQCMAGPNQPPGC